jgi:hypothetical protein
MFIRNRHRNARQNDSSIPRPSSVSPVPDYVSVLINKSSVFFTTRTRILRHAPNLCLLNKQFLADKLDLPFCQDSSKRRFSAFGHKFSSLGVVTIRWAPPLSDASGGVEKEDLEYLMSRTLIDSVFVVVKASAPFNVAIGEQIISNCQKSEEKLFINPDLTTYRIFQETILVRLSFDGPSFKVIAWTYPRCEEVFITQSCLYDKLGFQAQLKQLPSSCHTPGWFDYGADKNYQALGSVRLQWGPPRYAFNAITHLEWLEDDPSRPHSDIASSWGTFWVLPDGVPFDILVDRNTLQSCRKILRTEAERKQEADLRDQEQSIYSSLQNEREDLGEGGSNSPTPVQLARFYGDYNQQNEAVDPGEGSSRSPTAGQQTRLYGQQNETEDFGYGNTMSRPARQQTRKKKKTRSTLSSFRFFK